MSTRLSVARSNHRATAPIRVSRENDIIQSDPSDTSTKLSMLIWAMYEMHTEMVDVAGEIGVRLTKRLLNTCMKHCKVPEDWRTGLIVPHMETERRCTRPREVQRNNSAESYYETTKI